MVRIDRFDHLVLTVRDVEATCAFYEKVLGMQPVTFAGGRRALTFGRQKINLHQAGKEYQPHAHRPVAGSGDLCLISAVPLATVIAHLKASGVEILDGPVERTGALGPMQSVYFRDPDLNLIEISEYPAGVR
jgi:catechol 2,3-dioxygenase-like lactoylglutathione lyase family enzyme